MAVEGVMTKSERSARSSCARARQAIHVHQPRAPRIRCNVCPTAHATHATASPLRDPDDFRYVFRSVRPHGDHQLAVERPRRHALPRCAVHRHIQSLTQVPRRQTRTDQRVIKAEAAPQEKAH
jgi:hypothetical protein